MVQRDGFTLLESIITLIIASLFGTMLFSYFAVINRSIAPTEVYQNSLNLQRVMENITSDYYDIFGRNVYPQWAPSESYSSGDIVASKSIRFGHLFICVTEGISGDSEPQWKTTNVGTIGDGGVTWKEYLGELDPLISKVSQQAGDGTGINSYGQYQVKELRFIRFENNLETPVSTGEPENLLKLTIQNEQGETITSLFATSY